MTENGRQLPLGWETTTLGEIARINPPLDRGLLSDDVEVTFVPMRAVEPDGGGLSAPEMRKYGQVKTGYTSFVSGDVVMAKITPCMENGKSTVVPEVPGGVCFGSTEFHVMRTEAGVQPRWISQFLLQHDVRRAAQREMTGGVGQMRVPASFLDSLPIPLAPLGEQSRILDALEELFSDLDSGIAFLERVRAKLKLYRASVLRAAVEGMLTSQWRARHAASEPAAELLKRVLIQRRRQWEEQQVARFKAKRQELPKNWKAKYSDPVAPDVACIKALPQGWCWVTVDQCSRLIQYGTSAKTGESAGGVPVLRMGNIRSDGSLVLEKLKYLPSDHDEFPSLLLQPGDLLFNRTNSAELVGKTALYRGIPDPCSFASYLIRVRCLCEVAPAILAFSLNSALGRSWIKEVANQTVGQANVNGTKLASFSFPLPPVAEQGVMIEAVEAQLSAIDYLEADLDTKLVSARVLRQAILRRAFTGQLVPQDPSDEPASELLNRIAVERAARQPSLSRPRKPKKARRRN